MWVVARDERVVRARVLGVRREVHEGRDGAVVARVDETHEPHFVVDHLRIAVVADVVQQPAALIAHAERGVLHVGGSQRAHGFTNRGRRLLLDEGDVVGIAPGLGQRRAPDPDGVAGLVAVRRGDDHVVDVEVRDHVADGLCVVVEPTDRVDGDERDGGLVLVEGQRTRPHVVGDARRGAPGAEAGDPHRVPVPVPVEVVEGVAVPRVVEAVAVHVHGQRFDGRCDRLRRRACLERPVTRVRTAVAAGAVEVGLERRLAGVGGAGVGGPGVRPRIGRASRAAVRGDRARSTAREQCRREQPSQPSPNHGGHGRARAGLREGRRMSFLPLPALLDWRGAR